MHLEPLEPRLLLAASISGTKWFDADGDGNRGVGEQTLPGWTVFLDLDNDGQLKPDRRGDNFAASDTPAPFGGDPLPPVLRSTIDVSGLTGAVLDVNASVNLQHEFFLDATAFLISPRGTRVQLFEGLPGSGGLFGNPAGELDATFDDEARIPIAFGETPYNGGFQPEDRLSAYDGEAANGSWTLEVIDTFPNAGDGTLNSWSLEITSRQQGEPLAVTGADGAFSFAGLDGGTFTVREMLLGGWTQTWPAGTGSYTITLAADENRTGVDFGNRTAGIEGMKFLDLDQDGVFNNNDKPIANWPIFLDLDRDGQRQSGEQVNVFQSADVPVPIPDQAAPVTSETAVAGLSGSILDVDVTLDIRHDFNFDLDIFLVSPTGTRVQLISEALGRNFSGTTLDDEAIRPLRVGPPNYSGSLRPRGTLSDFDGQDPDGTWRVEIKDKFNSDPPRAAGSLNNWSLSITTPDDFEPQTLTDVQGRYQFAGLSGDSYTVSEALPDGYVQTLPGGDGTYTLTLGASQLATGIDFGNFAAAGRISGYKWNDLDGDGVRDEQDPAEPFVAGATIYLDLNNNGIHDPDEPSATTGGDGSYELADLPPGHYTVAEDLPVPVPTQSKTVITFPAGGSYEVNLGAGGVVEDRDFGNITLARIHGIKWDDQNGDGAFQGGAGETPLAGWTIFLDENLNGKLDAGERKTTTNALGEYQFVDLRPGDYRVAEVMQLGYTQTQPGGEEFYDVTAQGDDNVQLDFGNRVAEVFGLVFNDLNRNRAHDLILSEQGLDGWTVQLDLGDNGSVDLTTTTTALGFYGFSGVPVGTHRLSVELMEHYVQTFPGDPGTHQVEVTVSQDPEPANFGAFLKPDLVPTNLAVPAAEFGGTVDVTYDTAFNNAGAVGPNDTWSEQIWLTDDGVVDGQGFEIQMAGETFTQTGSRSTPVTMPILGATPSSQGNGTVTPPMLEAGLHVVVRIDPTADVLEADDTNNDAAVLANWKLPDLVIAGPVERPFVGVDYCTQQEVQQRRCNTNTISVSGELKYKVRNAGDGAIPEGMGWREQIWLGTDQNVLAPDNPEAGIFHVVLNDNVAGSGPLAAGSEVERTLVFGLNDIPLPKGMSPHDLQLFIFLDVPNDEQNRPAPPPNDTRVGAVLEKHEANPTADTNNILGMLAYDSVVRVSDTQGQASPLLEGSDYGFPTFSANGRYLAFASKAGNLTLNDTNNRADIFLYDRDTDEDGVLDEPGQTSLTRISDSFDGDGMLLGSGQPIVTADGSAVYFLRRLTNSTSEGYRYDVGTGDIEMFSRDASGEPDIVNGSQGPWRAFTVSGDGRLIAYGSRLSGNIVVRDQVAKRTQTLRRLPQVAGVLSHPAISGNGRFLAYVCSYNNICICVQERASGQGEVYSIETLGDFALGAIPSISDDGRYVAFFARTSTNPTRHDVFLLDRQEPKAEKRFKKLSVAPGEEASNGSSFPQVMTPDGRFVAYNSSASNLVQGDASAALDIFVYDAVLQRTTLDNRSATEAQGVGNNRNPAISPDGRWLAFWSSSRILDPTMPSGSFDLFIRDRRLPVVGEVHGAVFLDKDRDGQRNGDEPGLGGILIYVDQDNNGVRDAGDAFQRTERGTGAYRFKLAADREGDDDSYTVRLDLDDSQFQTGPLLVEANPPAFDSPGSYVVTLSKSDGSVKGLRINAKELPPTQPPDFGVFVKPDLAPENLKLGADAVALGRQVAVTYDVAQQRPNGLFHEGVPGNVWSEEFWLTHDGQVDGNGYEVRLTPAEGQPAQRFTGPGGIGPRSFTVTFPKLAPEDSTNPLDPDPKISAQTAAKGLQLVVRVDPISDAQNLPRGEVDEAAGGETNNIIAIGIDLLLPDLEVVDFGRPVLVFNQQLPELTYKVKNVGRAPVPDGLAWVEQVWLGVEPNVYDATGNDTFPIQISFQTFDTTSGPRNPGDEVQRTVVPDLTGVTLPPNIPPTDLNWIVLLDWPIVDADGGAVKPEDADPGVILEEHEVNQPESGDGEEPALPANLFMIPADTIDLSPLQLQVVGGDFQFNGQRQRFEAQGVIQLGFKPDEGDPFTPLVSLDGQAHFNREIISLDGTFRAEIGGITLPLFKGSFTITVGEAVTSLINEALGALPQEFTIAGVDVNFSRMEFVVPEGGTLADGQIEIQGTFVLPPLFGLTEGPEGENRITISIEDPHRFVISRDGFAITGGQAKLPFENVDVTIFNILRVRSEDVLLSFSTPPHQFTIQGRFQFKLLEDGDTINLDIAEPNFIRIREQDSQVHVDIVGQMTFEDIVIIRNVLEINEGRIFVDDITDEKEVEFSVFVPFGISIIAGIGTYQGQLNFLTLGVDDLDLAIMVPPGVPIARFQKVQGTLDNIADPREPFRFTGTVGFSDPLPLELGPIPLPEAVGGTVEGRLARLDISGSFDAHSLTGSIDLDVLDRLMTASGNVTFNWNQGFFQIGAGFQALPDKTTLAEDYALSGNFMFRIAGSFDITASGNISIRVPDIFPFPLDFLNGLTASAGFLQRFINDGDFSNDFLAGWGELAGFQAGLKVSLDGELTLLGASGIAALEGGEGDRSANYGASGEGGPPARARFPVASTADWVVLGARWDNAVGEVPIRLVAPDGTVIEETDFAAHPNISIPPGGAGSASKRVLVLDPAPGIWTIEVPDTSGLGTVTFAASGNPAVPSIRLTNPATDTAPDAQGKVRIDYEAFDPDSAARIEIFYDDDRGGYDGINIATGLTDSDGPGSFVWDTANVPGGDYYVYAIIDDGVNPPLFSEYSLGRIRVAAPGAPDAVTDVSAQWIGDGKVEVSWTGVPGAIYYVVSFSDDAAGEVLRQARGTDNGGNRVVISELTEGETYRFAVRAVNAQRQLGPIGAQAVAVVGPSATIAPSGDQWDVFAQPGTRYTQEIAMAASDSLTLVQGPAGSSVDDGTRQFTWEVPADADGFFDVVINVQRADGTTDQLRRVLLSDSDFAGSIAGQKFADLNGNGLRDLGELGINGLTVELLDAITREALLAIATADHDVDDDGAIDPRTEAGRFRFDSLAPGQYLVREVLPAGALAVTPAEVELTVTGGEEAIVDFANQLQTGSIHGLVWHDENGDGLRDSEETGLAGVTVLADINQNGRLDTYEVSVASDHVPIAIADLSTVRSTVVLDGLAGTIADVNVTLDIDHAYLGDLDVFLISPRGTRIMLFTDVGGDGGQMSGLRLDDGAAAGINNGSAPFTGRFRPEGRLRDLRGEVPNGVWTLEISDDQDVDVGQLTSWSLTLTIAEPSTQTTADDPATAEDETGRYGLVNLPAGTYRVREIIPDGFVQTAPAEPFHEIVLAGGQTVENVDFGNQENPFPWHNGVRPLDVNNDGNVVPTDVLLVINELNNRRFSDPQTGRLFDRTDPNAPFYDVDRNGFATPADALHIINFLNKQAGGEAQWLAPASPSMAIEHPVMFAWPFRAGASNSPAARHRVAAHEMPRWEQVLDHYFAQDRVPDREFYDQQRPIRRTAGHQFDPLELDHLISDIAADVFAARYGSAIPGERTTGIGPRG